MSDAPKWVPLIEGARIIGRHLAGESNDRIEREIAVKACGLFSAAAREGSVAGEGWRDGAAEREKLTIDDWISHRIDFSRNRLEPQEPTMRRVHPDRIQNVVVDALDVRGLLEGFAWPEAAEASKVSPKIRRPSEAEAVRLLQGLRSRMSPDLPTNAQDEAEIEESFPGAPRSHARKARKSLAPPGGYPSGPGSRNPAAEK